MELIIYGAYIKVPYFLLHRKNRLNIIKTGYMKLI